MQTIPAPGKERAVIKDLSTYFAPDLQLTYGTTTYTVPPPSKDTGLKLAAINAVGVAAWAQSTQACPTCGRTGTPEVPAETLDLVQSLNEVDLGELSLGPAYRQMLDDAVPAAHIDTMALYAMYYWTLGEQVADQIVAASAGAPGEAHSGSSTSPHGPRTASAPRTRKASTPATGASPTA